jgi:nicotinamidase-related amidase
MTDTALIVVDIQNDYFREKALQVVVRTVVGTEVNDVRACGTPLCLADTCSAPACKVLN